MQSNPPQKITRRKFSQYGLGLPLVTASCGHLQTRSIRVVQETYHIPQFQPAGTSFTIGIISDFHAGCLGNKALILESIKLLNDKRPDLICLLGDYIDGGRQHGSTGLARGEYIFSELATLSAPHGIFAVLGNHDHWVNDKEISQQLRQQNIQVLSNSNYKLDNGLVLSGVDDLWSGANITEALQGITPEKPTILLSHNPDINHSLGNKSSVDLVLSGHTHGRQARVPIVNWAPWTPCSKKYHGRIGMVKETQQRSTYLTCGVRTFVLPLRFFCPPEITILTLTG